MPEEREGPAIPGWIWIAVAAVAVGVPIVASLCVPAPPARPPSQAFGPSSDAPPERAGDPDLGVTAPRTPYDVAYDAIELEQAALRIEKAAIEADEGRIRRAREELEEFEQGHPDGVPPELYARYEDARATYNSDVQAFKSRASAYTMKVDELERRIEALGPTAP